MEKVVSSLRRVSDGFLFWALSIAGIGLLFLVVGLPIIRQRQTMEQAVHKMSERNKALNAKVGQLQKERVALRSDPFYVEKLARRSLSMSRPGEMEVNTPLRSRKNGSQSKMPLFSSTQPTELRAVHGVFSGIAEDNLLRQIAFVLGLLTLVVAIMLFRKSPKHHPA